MENKIWIDNMSLCRVSLWVFARSILTCLRLGKFITAQSPRWNKAGPKLPKLKGTLC